MRGCIADEAISTSANEKFHAGTIVILSETKDLVYRDDRPVVHGTNCTVIVVYSLSFLLIGQPL